jgi:group I intron endonuclease
MQHFIYKTTNKINGKWYIGQHSGSVEDDYLGSGTALKKATAKYGKENFIREIIQFAPNKETLNKLEEAYVSEYDVADPMCYNLKSGGDQNIILSSATKAKISATMKGKKQAEETKAKMSAAHKGRKHSEETKAKITAAKKGRKPSEETKAKMSAAHKGKKASEESKAKLSAIRKGKKKSEETRVKMSQARLAYYAKLKEQNQ